MLLQDRESDDSDPTEYGEFRVNNFNHCAYCGMFPFTEEVVSQIIIMVCCFIKSLSSLGKLNFFSGVQKRSDHVMERYYFNQLFPI